MTRKGDKAKPDAKRKARYSNPFSTAIKTPDGIFRSINECAEYYNRAPGSIVHRCKMGEQQRRTKTKTSLQEDWTGWEFWGKGRRPPKRRVRTPLGDFDSLLAAGKAHGVQAGVIRKKCMANITGFSFIEEEKK